MKLEEAAKRYTESTPDNDPIRIKSFIAGAKWQQEQNKYSEEDMGKWMEERMYSEKEVLQLLLRLQQTESYDNLYDWFEQFKKK